MKDINKIINKYWEGQSDPEEDKLIEKHVSENTLTMPENEYFNYLKHKRQEKIDNPDFETELLQRIADTDNSKKKIKIRGFLKVAVSIVLLVGLSFLLLTKTELANRIAVNATEQDTYEDPQLAFEETKKALMMVSENLNKGKAYSAELSKFSESQEKLKN